jgi:hypothetical protein
MSATSRQMMKRKLQWESILSTHEHVAMQPNKVFAKAAPFVNTSIRFFMK